VHLPVHGAHFSPQEMDSLTRERHVGPRQNALVGLHNHSFFFQFVPKQPESHPKVLQSATHRSRSRQKLPSNRVPKLHPRGVPSKRIPQDNHADSGSHPEGIAPLFSFPSPRPTMSGLARGIIGGECGADREIPHSEASMKDPNPCGT